jgi:hypothetical protein
MTKNAGKIYKESRTRPAGRSKAMRAAKIKEKPAPNVEVPVPPVSVSADDLNQALILVGGSKSEEWNSTLVNQILDCVWVRDPDDTAKAKQATAALSGAAGINPKDELEGMLAAQMLAAHNAAMECYRQATVATAEGKNCNESLSQANKFSRTYVTLLEALNRHRGNVQPVHIYIGGKHKRGARG